jgi:hypothetical protein
VPEPESFLACERVEHPANQRLVCNPFSHVADEQTSTAPTRFLPAVDQPLDVAALSVAEGEAGEQPARLVWVVVRHSGLEMLAFWRWLAQLAAEPAEQADRRLVGHGYGRALPL